MEVSNLINNAKHGEITAYIGGFSLDNSKILPTFKDDRTTVIDHFLTLCEKEKVLKALLVLDIKENILNSNVGILSASLRNKLAVVEALVSKEDTFIFQDVHKSLTYREIQNIKRVLKKIAEHNKKVIVVTNDVEFLFGLTKIVYGVKNDFITNLSPIDWFADEIYNYVSKPPIIEFVSNCKKRNIKIDNCYETKELLKAIYRSVGK